MPSFGLDDDDYVTASFTPPRGIVEELICSDVVGSASCSIFLFICGSATSRPSARAFGAAVVVAVVFSSSKLL